MFYILYVCLVCFAISASGKIFTGEASGDRLNGLKELSAASGNGLIELDDSNFDYFAIDKPRDYSLMIFLTAANPRYKCVVCKDTENDVKKVAHAYSSAVSREGGETDMFFVKVDFERGQRVFSEYKLQTVPILFYMNKKEAVGEGKSRYDIPIKDRYSFPESTTAESIADWVNYKTGVNVVFEKSLIMAYIMTILCFVGIIALIPRIINSVAFWKSYLQWKPLWVFVSAAVYVCSISGLIYDIIRSPPWYHNEPRSGGIVFFYPQAGQQMVIEGFIIGFLNIGCAASLIFLYWFAPTLKTAEQRTVGIIGGMASFSFFFWQVRQLYVMKNRWYGSDV